MKNSKGMTLMETLIAIMILSISALIIFAGFSTVMKTMARSATLKNESDILLSYIEKTGQNDLRTQVNKSKLPSFNYKIKNSKDAEVIVSGNGEKINVKQSNLIWLMTFTTNKKELVKNTNAYLDVTAYAKKNHTIMKNLIDAIPKESYDIYEFKSLIKTAYTEQLKQKYDTFPNELLPILNSSICRPNLPHYIKVYFPWDIKKSQLSFEHGGMLIYLSQDDDLITNKTADEPVYIIYDYDSGKWYYYPYDGITKKTEYILKHPDVSLTPDLYIDGDNTKVNSWSELKKHIADPANGWQMLDTNAQIDSSIWKDVN